jgi:hypothetical protein
MENEHEHEKTIGYQPKALDYMNRKEEKTPWKCIRGCLHGWLAVAKVNKGKGTNLLQSIQPMECRRRS